MYSAEFGRFLSVDPLFEAMPRHTPYHYSFNSPLVWSDPSGLMPENEKDQDRLMEEGFGSMIYYAGESANHHTNFSAEVDFIFRLRWNDFYLEAAYEESTLTFRDMIMSEFGDINSRTGIEGFGENGVYFSYDVTTDAQGNETYSNFKLILDLSQGQLEIPIDFSDGSVSNAEQLQYVEQLAGAFDTILQADPTYFDPLFGGDYTIDISSGFNIALTTPNAIVKGNYYPGMHCPDEISDNKATIKIASELFSGKVAYTDDGRIYSNSYPAEYSNWFNSIFGSSRVKYSVWEAVAHEFGHHLDFLKYGRSTFNSWDYDPREINTMNRVNALRRYYNMRQEYHIPLNERKQ